MEYEAVIGIEVHVQLLTRSKMFCGCSAEYATGDPNSHVCPVCLGMPGVLPVINRKAIESTIMTALALHCEIAQHSKFDRKNYPYPDLPKGYQISQYDMPLARDGWLEINVNGESRRIGIERIHQEEDTAKLLHAVGRSLVDFNRSGMPLMEIVGRPELRTPEEARQYLIKLRTILRYLGVSTGNMEDGAMRCEANVSLMPMGSEVWGTKVEIKNLNSFRAVKLALEYEIEQQKKLLDRGQAVRQVTVGWDEEHRRTVFQRSKEYANDYRYFPEPDLPLLVLDSTWIEEIRGRMPELPDAKRQRFDEQYGLSGREAAVLVDDRQVADYFEACVEAGSGKDGKPPVEARSISSWISGELFRLMHASGTDIENLQVRPPQIVELLRLTAEGTINLTVAKEVFEEMFPSGRDASDIVSDRGLKQISDADELTRIVEQVLDTHPAQVAEFLGGKEAVLQYLMGQVMKATRGKANPKVVIPLLKRLVESKKTGES